MNSKTTLLTLSLAVTACTALAAPDPIRPDDHPLQGYNETEGDFYNKRTYTQNSASHVVLLTQSDYYQTHKKFRDYDEVCMNKDIHAYGYVEDGKVNPTLQWKMYDFIHDCETSARLEYADGFPMITDLDNDGVKEIWIGYYKGCHGDVSPDELKLFMYINGKKHAIRGHNRIFVDGHYAGGEYKLDEAMSKAGKIFGDYGVSLFLKIANEK